MGKTILALIALAIVIAGLMLLRKRLLRSKCSCCSGSSVRQEKVLEKPIIRECTLVIAGLCCEHCAIRVENALNELPDVLATIDWQTKRALVRCSAEVADETLRRVVEEKGYSVTEIL